MIAGIGTDIVEITNIGKLTNYPNGISRIYTDREQEYASSKSKPLQHYAGMWAAKEAVIKATGMRLPMRRIEILHHTTGEPYVENVEWKKSHADTYCKISISHSDHYANAVAIVSTY